MLNYHRYENSAPDGFSTLEVIQAAAKAGRHKKSDALSALPFVPLIRTELSGAIVGPLADLTITQVFQYSSERCSHVIEAAYRFPLPGDAAVTGVRIHFGEVEIRAALAERASAEREYEQAREEGRQATLVTRESPDVFTLRVAGLKPDEPVTVETTYVQLAQAEGAGWSLRVPLTTAPRFVRQDERGSPAAKGQPLRLLRDPGHRFALDLTLEGASTVEDRGGVLAVTELDSRFRIRLCDGEILPDRDLVVTWLPRQSELEPTGHVYLHDDAPAGETFFLATVCPPLQKESQRLLPREVILLLDHSGSMTGPKWEAADWAVNHFLAGLMPGDTFNLGLFHDDTQWFSERPTTAAPATVNRAAKFMADHKDTGGTELGVALERALTQPRSPGERGRHVLIVTDAQVTDSGRILELVERESAQPDRRRVSVLCIDSAPNSTLARELAERGGGVAHFLTSDPKESDITTALESLLADWAAPVATGLYVAINRPGAQPDGHLVRLVPDGGSEIDLGDVPCGRSIWLAGRAPMTVGGPGPGFEIRDAAGRVVSVKVSTDANRPSIMAVFGARRVLELETLAMSGSDPTERLRRLGYGPEHLPAANTQALMYQENARHQTSEAIRGLLVNESLRYGVVSSETAFVATRLEAGRRVEGLVVVPNAVPHGWTAYSSPPPGAQTFMPRSASATSQTVADMDDQHYFNVADRSPSMFDQIKQQISRHLGSGGPQSRAQRPHASPPPADDSPPTSVFAGTPVFEGVEAILFESADRSALPAEGRIRRIQIRLDRAAWSHGLDGLEILVFVADLTTPRVRARLTDVLAPAERPFNLQVAANDTVRITLFDPRGLWAGGAPNLELIIG